MFNLIAYAGEVAANAALANVTPVPDPLVTISQNGRFILPMDSQIWAANAIVPDGTRARINTPSFRVLALPEITPIDTSAGQEANPVLMLPGPGNLKVIRNEEVGIDVSRGGAGAADAYVFLWVGDRMAPSPGGAVFSVRWTATVTAVVRNWVLGSLAFDQTLPFGRYAVIGMTAYGTNLLAARLAFPGNTQYRPGVPATTTLTGYVNPQVFRFGGMGVFGTFEQTAQPNLEIMGSAAGSISIAGVLDLIKVA